jgi:UDP-3-O-[3-hydroxymyristoyl] N-acetylglucosamine deacetylase
MRLQGRGLHTGAACAVTFAPSDGPTTINGVRLTELRVDGRDRCSVAVIDDREIMTIEHLLSAIVGAAAFHNVAIEIDGNEIPLLDGASAQFFDALPPVSRERERPVTVLKPTVVQAHNTTLTLTPHNTTDITIEVDYPQERFGRPLQGTARWQGDPAKYRESIATARTFGASHELESLRARGLAAHIEPGSIIALDRTDAWAPADPHEPIRHKLLDALGDLATVGGPILGRIHIHKPSHHGTRAALALCRDVFTQPGEPLRR